MYEPHRHHILDWDGQPGAHRALVREGQDILREVDIDPILGLENLVWAPNKGHTIGATRSLVDDLRAARGSRSDIVEILRMHGDAASGR